MSIPSAPTDHSPALRQAPELLSPAGDETCLTAALDAGADAVYFGTSSFNMRARAGNFPLGELPRIAGLCHEREAKAYLALNTIVYESELGALETVLDAAVEAGADAVICWDGAVIEAVKARGLAVHLSTQASVSNSRSIAAHYRNHGIRRFVLARECSLAHIAAIRENLRKILGDEADEIELELFVHGAMCVSVSGRCFLSESVTGDSGNRGACLQPCRREYRVVDVEGEYEFDIGRDYVMSPKDLCTMPFLEKILESGAACLKIEGRMRNPEYVSTVIGAYREAVDYWADRGSGDEGFGRLKEGLVERMRTVFNRGFSSGYYMGRPVGDWAGAPDSQAAKRKESVGVVANYYAKRGVAEILVQSAAVQRGDELIFQGPTTGNLEVVIDSMRVDGEPAESGDKGDRVTLEVPRRVRRNDAVFRRYAVDGKGGKKLGDG